MTSLYLRLAAPVQSWAGARVTGNVVQTGSRPTASALRGLLAACAGWRRGAWEPWIEEVSLVVRVEHPGIEIDEFQTIGPRDEDVAFQKRLHLMLTGGTRGGSSLTPDGGGGTAIINRTYLAGASFLVEITAPAQTSELREYLREPRFVPYLGRKAFAPTFPFYLGEGEEGALETLPAQQVSGGQVRRSSGLATHASAGVTASVTIHPLTAPEPPRPAVVPLLPQQEWLDSVADRLQR